MTYRTAVEERLAASPSPQSDRTALWTAACDEYDRGGEVAVSELLDRKAVELERAIEKAMKSIDSLL